MNRRHSPLTDETVPPPVHGGFWNATTEECDLCHDWFPLPRLGRSDHAILYNGIQFLCPVHAAES